MILKQLLSHLLPATHRWDDTKSENRKKLVMLFAQGNVCLQRGQYITAEDIKKKKQALASFSF